jgi:acetyl-CoA carboxylase alpha subunit
MTGGGNGGGALAGAAASRLTTMILMMTYLEIAQRLDLTPEAVRQIEFRALEKMRMRLLALGVTSDDVRELPEPPDRLGAYRVAHNARQSR